MARFLVFVLLLTTGCAHHAERLDKARTRAEARKRAGWGVPAAHLRLTKPAPGGIVSVLGWARDGSAFGVLFTIADGFCASTHALLVDATGSTLQSDQDGHCDVITDEIRKRAEQFHETVNGWTVQHGLDVDPAATQPRVRVDDAGAVDDTEERLPRDTARVFGWAGPVFAPTGGDKVQLRSASGALLGSAEVPGDRGVVVPVASPDGERIAWIVVRDARPSPTLRVIVTPAR